MRDRLSHARLGQDDRARHERLNEQYTELFKNNLGMDLGYIQAKAFEIDLLAKEKEITQLVEDIKKLQIKANKSREFYESQRV